jgi:hypothetical protein
VDAFFVEEGLPALGSDDTLVLVVAGNVPPATLRHAASGAGRVRIVRVSGSAAARRPADEMKSWLRRPGAAIECDSAGYMPQYGAAEDELSSLCATLATRVTGTLRRLCEQTPGLETLSACLDALSIRFDDAFFTATVPLWGAIQAAFHDGTRHAVVVSDDPTFASAFFAAALGLERTADVTFLGTPTSPLDADVVTSDDLAEVFAAARPAPDSAATARADLLRLHADGRAAAQQGLPRGGCLVVGRPLDRNYRADVAALCRALLAYRGVALMPTNLRLPENRLAAQEIRAAGVPDEVILAPGPERSGRRDWLRQTMPLQEHAYGLVARDLLSARDLPPVADAILVASQPALQRLLEQTLPGLVHAVGEIEGAILAMRPQHVVVSPGRDWIARVACIVAKREGIKSIDVQTVFVGPRSRYRRTLADKQFAIDTQARAIFEGYFGMRPDDVALAGCAKLGALQVQIRAADPAPLLRRLDAQGRQLVSFAASPILADCLPVARALAIACAQDAGFVVVVKLHPSADEDQAVAYAELTALARGRFSVVANAALSEVIAASSVVVTRFSNVGLEAALAGKSVIACRFGEGIPAIPLDRMGVAAAADSPESLAALLRDLLGNGPISRTLAASRAAYTLANPQLLAEDIPAEMALVIERWSDAVDGLGSRRGRSSMQGRTP